MDKKKLDSYLTLLQSSILCYQNHITGLIPSNRSSSHAWVRDNIYASLSIWGLSLAFRKLPDVDEDRSRGYELEKCVIKLMRGILVCYMKQSAKVELFKVDQNPLHSLHAKFDAVNCRTVVGDNEWGHLQIDAVSLYLVTLAQMTAAGLRIIWTVEEVAFIQNLVFCIEHAYRIPDYGIWERGDKTNHGLPELNSTSVGMAKAALEALTDLDLFGADGSPLSTIHVSPDECQQCNTVVHSMLPRESNSKETDAGLLSILSYPGFAVSDDELIERSRRIIINKLLGRYGCRRFLRDGYRTAREDPNRLYYEPWELRMFDGIECEWPMFLAWLVIDASFREDYSDADRFMNMLQEVVIPESHSEGSFSHRAAHRKSIEAHTVRNTNCYLIPELYTLAKENIQAEIAHPHSQSRISVGALPHIWGQSLYLLASIIYDGLLLPGEIDPLGRRMVTEPKPDLSVQVVLVAENEKMRTQLLEYSNEIQTFDEILVESGIRIYPAKVLSYLYKHLGVCEKLHLSGRASREVGVLSTSRFYRFGDQTLAFMPQFFDHHSFYLNLDVEFLLDSFRTCVAYLKHAWTSPGRPLLIFPLYERYFPAGTVNSQSVLCTAIRKMASGYMNATHVTLGRLKKFGETSCLKNLDFCESAELLLSKAHSLTDTHHHCLTHSQCTGHSDTKYHDDGTASSHSGEFVESELPPAAYGSDSIHRHSLRRKSMALVEAVSIDLFKRGSVDWVIGSQSSDKNTDDDQSEVHMDEGKLTVQNYRLLQQQNEDLSSNASQLALRRIIYPDSNLKLNCWATEHESPSKQPHRDLDPNRSNQASQQNSVNSNGSSRRISEGRELDSCWQWLDNCTVDQLVQHLKRTSSLAEQVQLLGRLHQLQGLFWDTGIDVNNVVTVRSLLKEVYERATQTSSWFLLRYIAGLLGKRADTLATSLTSILVLQKQITVGLPPEPREKVIDAPLPPDRIAELIQEACGEDIFMNMFTQELLIYLSMIARTSPQQLSNILRLRTGLIIQMMAAELARAMDLTVEDSLYALFSMCPIDTKRLLQNLLNGTEIRMVKSIKHRKSVLSPINPGQSMMEDTLLTISGAVKKLPTAKRLAASRSHTHGDPPIPESDSDQDQLIIHNVWSRRRKIDGTLNRVPPGFYKRVYTILTHAKGLRIRDQVLSHQLIEEMTMDEHKFALTVERVCTRISTPEYRQLIIEAVHVLGSLLMHDIDNSVFLDIIIKVEDVVENANRLFLLDQVKYNANAILCCGKQFQQQDSVDLSTQTYRRQSSLQCHGLHNICQHFYDTPPAGRFGTMSYMVRAVSQLLAQHKCVNDNGLLSTKCNVQ